MNEYLIIYFCEKNRMRFHYSIFIYSFFFLFLFSCNTEIKENPKNQEIQDAKEKEIVDEIDSLPDYPLPTQDSPEFDDLTSTVEFDSANYEWKDGYIQCDWQMLSRVIFEDRYINDTFAMVPIFHDEIKILAGKPIQIKGYIIPSSEAIGAEDGKLHVLSAYPFTNCFFCGGAGPETVMDINTKKAHDNFKLDDVHSFRGVLELNDSNLNYLNYILRKAELVRK